MTRTEHSPTPARTQAMTYVALLRGINVGGNRKVPMKDLAALFECVGMERVRTYINSGNVIFRHAAQAPEQIAHMLEREIEQEFGFAVDVLVKTGAAITQIADALPESWVNDDSAKCDVLYLWHDMDNPSVLDEVTIKPDIDDVRYVPGALLWHVERSLVTRSGLVRVVGSPLYQRMTVRNCNTARKLAELVGGDDD